MNTNELSLMSEIATLKAELSVLIHQLQTSHGVDVSKQLMIDRLRKIIND